MQKIIKGEKAYKNIEEILKDLEVKKYLLVCDSAFEFLSIKDYFGSINIPYVKFSNFTANPLYLDVEKGVGIFKREECDAIVTVGGGSAIDVAKCIKLFSKMDTGVNFLKQNFFDSGIPLIAIPTTAGTGSESTKFAVIYYEGKKQSVSHESIIPNFAILVPSLLDTLPLYQKKCTLLDALCQGIESWWSQNSTSESIEYSKKSVVGIIKNYRRYLSGEANEEIMLCANFAGRAINITQTTAAHAMSYKITSLFSLPHGHAVAICLPYIWEYMIWHPEKCVDPRGSNYLQKVFFDIANALNCTTPQKGVEFLKLLLSQLGIEPPKVTDTQLDILTASVNTQRLRNNPVELDNRTIRNLYEDITK